MKLSDVITPGDKIDIKFMHEANLEVNGGKDAVIYQSSVCDIFSDTDLEISMPTHGGRMVLFQTGAECIFVFYTKGGMYRCFGVVQDRYREGNLYLLSVHMSTPPVKFQRREFFRVNYVAQMQYYEITEEVAGLKTTEELYACIQNVEYENKAVKAMIQDISGGGVRFTSKQLLKEGDFVLIVTRLTNDRIDETFYLACRIVDSQKNSNVEDLYIHRAKFIFKDLKDRDKIVRFVFEEERKIRRKELG